MLPNCLHYGEEGSHICLNAEPTCRLTQGPFHFNWRRVDGYYNNLGVFNALSDIGSKEDIALTCCLLVRLFKLGFVEGHVCGLPFFN